MIVSEVILEHLIPPVPPGSTFWHIARPFQAIKFMCGASNPLPLEKCMCKQTTASGVWGMLFQGNFWHQICFSGYFDILLHISVDKLLRPAAYSFSSLQFIVHRHQIFRSTVDSCLSEVLMFYSVPTHLEVTTISLRSIMGGNCRHIEGGCYLVVIEAM